MWDLQLEKALQQVQAAVQAALPLGPYDQLDLTVLKVFIVDMDAVWNRWQAPTGESKKGGFGILEQGSVINCKIPNVSLRDSFLACCWALVETECLTVNRQDIQSELPIMSWV